jgi:hypothetical protein
MEIAHLQYAASMRKHTRLPPLDYEVLDAANAHCAEGRYAESLATVLAHLFPTHKIPDLQVTPFTFTHGVARVHVSRDGEDISIRVPLVALPSTPSGVAAMRHVLTKMSGSGQTHQPRVHSDGLHLEYRDKLAFMHPAKMREALFQMPTRGDASINLLVGEFGATPIETDVVVPMTADEQAHAHAIWQVHWTEIEQLLAICRRQKSLFLLNEITAIARYRLIVTLPLMGLLNTRLLDAAYVFNDTDNEPDRREVALAKCARQMLAATPVELAGSLGHAQYAVTVMREGAPQTISEYLGPCNYTRMIDERRKGGHAMEAAVALVSTYYYLLSQYTWQPDVEAVILGGLAMSHARPWRETANALFEYNKKFVKEHGADSETNADREDGTAQGNEARQ